MIQRSIQQIMFSLWLLLPALASTAQPYLDIGKLSYYYGKRSQLYSINITLPIELKKGGDAIIVNPFHDENHVQTDARDFRVSSVGIMAGFLKKGIAKKWDLMISVIVRKNKQVNVEVTDDWQTGGLVLATFKQNESRSFKVGAYYNREFFGNFFMPLIGIDWKINEKTNLFGVLPGSMTLERKVTPVFYYGASFRALTNSYRLRTKDYLRINDNQLGIFGDVYFFKRIVFSAEAGHTIMRKFKFGLTGDIENDDWYAKATLAYRLRF